MEYIIDCFCPKKNDEEINEEKNNINKVKEKILLNLKINNNHKYRIEHANDRNEIKIWNDNKFHMCIWFFTQERWDLVNHLYHKSIYTIIKDQHIYI